MKDTIVLTELRRRGLTLANLDEILRYEAVEQKPRVLDKPPKKLSFVKASEITPYGCCAEYVLCYNDIKESTNLEQGIIDVPSGRHYCDTEVFVALQALIQQGYTMSAERSAACFELFKDIALLPEDVITVKRVEKMLMEFVPRSYYEGELLKALQVCLLNEKKPVIYWVSQCEYTGFYTYAFELGKDVIRSKCETEKDVDKFLRPLLKEARKDKEFMSGIYKQAANKWLIPMLYYLRDSNPEALDPNAKGGDRHDVTG